MDTKTLFDLTYGVFLLSTKSEDKKNACITNTCIRVASSPTRVAISVLNSNYTCDLIKKSGVFALTVLDNTVNFETIRHFGMQSGRDVDKFASFNAPSDEKGIPYISWQACSIFSCTVLESVDLGSHTLFIAEIDDAKKLSSNPPLTYADYHKNVKPKPVAVKDTRKIVAWKCKICGYVYRGAELPKDFLCPLCGHDASDFEPIFE